MRHARALAISVLASLTMAACTQEAPPAPPPAPTPQAGSINTSPSNITALFDKLSTAKLPQQGSKATALVREATQKVYESPYKEKIRQPGPLEQPLQRVGGEAADTTRLFPAFSAEVPKVWIGWYLNHSIDAFREAIDRNRPLVLVIAEDWCKFCVNLATNALRCGAVDRFAGDAVFAYSFPSADKGAFAIAGSLGIDAYPTITVLEPEARMLLERGRINGFFEASTLGQHLDTIVWKTQPRTYEEQPTLSGAPAPPRVPWTPPAGGPATAASALLGAASRGLSHAAPAPKCQ